jgi:hypothetical protein
MAQPVWLTDAGDLGSYPSNSSISIQLQSEAVAPATNITYTLISGSLPTGQLNALSLSTSGLISGLPAILNVDTKFDFTVRITDEFSNFRDRTFSITVAGIQKPTFTTPKGQILNILDSKWTEFQLQYSNPLHEQVEVVLTSGILPPGLDITSSGVIRGYAEPPLNGRIPVIKTYDFTVAVKSSLGIHTSTYSITVRNHRFTHPLNTRPPVILNSRPLKLPLDAADPYFDYYLINEDTIYVDSGAFITFKIIGKDFDGGDFVYEFNELPLGLVGDTKTGWISGRPILSSKGISKYKFNVRVTKADNPTIFSEFSEYFFAVRKEVVQDIEWISPSDLGIIYNGTISDLSVTATSSLPLQYRIVGGALPPNLSLSDTGHIIGRTPFQPNEALTKNGDKTEFTFAIQAYNTDYNMLNGTKTFTLTIQQYYDKPLENVYIKAAPGVPQRKLLKAFLNDETIFPTEMLFRPEDPYFGKSSVVSFVHVYGSVAASLETYLSAMGKNHSDLNLLIGDVKTAIAKDKDGNILYEVVYCDIIDDADTSDKSIFWEVPISRNLGPYDTGAGEIFTSDVFGNKFHTSLSPGTVRTLYPPGLKNMRAQVASVLGQNLDSNVLPKWMTSQQVDGSIIGYIPAWVICYTIAGASETIRDNIINNIAFPLNTVEFTVDRYIIDKSGTFNWNPYMTAMPGWTELPSASPTPSPLDTDDLVVVFPEKTILPKNTY